MLGAWVGTLLLQLFRMSSLDLHRRGVHVEFMIGDACYWLNMFHEQRGAWCYWRRLLDEEHSSRWGGVGNVPLHLGEIVGQTVAW